MPSTIASPDSLAAAARATHAGDTAAALASARAEATYRSAQAFFAALAAAGVSRVCVSPGSRSTPLTLCAHHEPGLELSVHLDERSAGFFALGLAKASRAPVALICTSGTAAANYLPAVVEAHYAGVPLIVITADRPPELRERGAGQTIDQVKLYGTHVRAFFECPLPLSPRQAASYAGRAIADANGARPGPVHLNWPLRDPLEPPDDFAFESAPTPRRGPIRPAELPRAHEEDEREIAELVLSNERGLFTCGDRDGDDAFPEALVDLATVAGWPILADATSQLRRGPHAKSGAVLATGDALLRSDGADGMRPDVVVRFGGSPISKAQRQWLERAKPQHVWTVSEPGVQNDPDHLATRNLVVSKAALCRSVAARVRAVRPVLGSRGWQSAWRAAEEAAASHLRRALDLGSAPEGAVPLCEALVARELTRTLPPNALLYASNSMPIRDLELVLACDERPLRVLCHRGANGIDGVTSGALGAADARLGPVVLLTGDLAFLHDVGGLAAAASSRGNATIVVIDNDGGGIFSHLPIAAQCEAREFEDLFRAPHGLALEHASALYGLRHHRTTGLCSFRTALSASLRREGVDVIEVPLDPDTNLARFRALIHGTTASADAAWGSAS